jgi:hypothetical protein
MSTENTTDIARVGSGPLVRRCFATIKGYDAYGRPRLVKIYDQKPHDIPEGERLVDAQVRIAENGNIRWWDLVPTWGTHGCSTPGCGFPDGRRCIRCGLTIPPNTRNQPTP